MATMILDRPLARRLVKEAVKAGEDVERAEVVLAGDEFWNTETIWENGKKRVQRDFRCYGQSYWATPTLVIYYKDGKQKRIPVYTTPLNTTGGQ